MTIEAKIIADSISEEGIRLTTVQLKYPRFIHAEFMTHRVFSRNASSSRAIPVKRMIQDILDDTAMPIHWGKNQPGMQAKEEHSGTVYIPYIHYGIPAVSPPVGPSDAWLRARDRAVEMARAFADAGYHKQIVNRLLEPFQHIHVVVTATDWGNFFALRRHEDAQPEIKALADAMHAAMEDSTPKLLKHGEWHVPYVSQSEIDQITQLGFSDSNGGVTEEGWLHLIKRSVARCARVSYLKHDGGEPSVEDDLSLYDRLINRAPIHASPAEHQAKPDSLSACDIYNIDTGYDEIEYRWDHGHQHGNLTGFIQFRKTLPNEVVK